MLRSSILCSALRRAGFCAALALLAGCAIAPKQALVEVISPPAPASGSERIVAYDSFAGALFAPASKPQPAAAIISEAVTAIMDDKHPGESTLD